MMTTNPKKLNTKEKLAAYAAYTYKTGKSYISRPQKMNTSTFSKRIRSNIQVSTGRRLSIREKAVLRQNVNKNTVREYGSNLFGKRVNVPMSREVLEDTKGLRVTFDTRVK